MKAKLFIIFTAYLTEHSSGSDGDVWKGFGASGLHANCEVSIPIETSLTCGCDMQRHHVCLSLRVLVQGVCSYLSGNATAEESEVAKKNLEHIDQELGASGHGLLDDQEVRQLEDDLAAVYYQLGVAVRKFLLTCAARRVKLLSMK